MTTLHLLPALEAPTEARPRFATPRNWDRETLGADVAAIATRYGKSFMPWQREVVDIAYELDPVTGRLYYTEIVILVPRQSGKTTLILPVATHRALAWSEKQGILYTAQSRKAARKKWSEEHVAVIRQSPFIRQVVDIREANGDEGITWRNGSVWGIDAPTETGAHGSTLGLGIGDEYWAHRDARVEQAMSPAMITVRDSQKWFISTAGKHWSQPLKRKVDAGRARVSAGLPSRILYLEYSMPDEADVYDERNWWENMPALGHTIEIEKVRAEAESLDEDEFRRAYGNQWREGYFGDWLIPQDPWGEQFDVSSEMEPGTLVWVPDVAPDMASSSLGVAGVRADGDIHIQVIENMPGTAWLPSFTGQMQRQFGGDVWADLTGPISSIAGRFAEESINLLPATSSDMLSAPNALLEGITGGTTWHLNQIELNLALAGASKSIVGDRWKWTRGKSMSDISALVAVSIAHLKVLASLPDRHYDPLAGIQ